MKKNRPKAIASTQIDNERVIVTQWCFGPNAETGWHKHDYDYIVVPEISGDLLIESEEGNKIAQLLAGESYYRAMGTEHNVVNNNNFKISFVEIELR